MPLQIMYVIDGRAGLARTRRSLHLEGYRAPPRYGSATGGNPAAPAPGDLRRADGFGLSLQQVRATHLPRRLNRAGDRLLLASLVDHTNRLGARTVCRSRQGLMSAPALAGRLGNSDCGPGRCVDGRDGASTRWRRLSGQADSRRRSERLRLLRERDGQRVSLRRRVLWKLHAQHVWFGTELTGSAHRKTSRGWNGRCNTSAATSGRGALYRPGRGPEPGRDLVP
jgi:hypothetical protein